MEVIYSPNVNEYKSLSTEKLRESFLLEDLFQEGKISLIYSDVDRAIIGGIVPGKSSATGGLKLKSSKKEMAAKYFAERREIGIINIGSKGSIHTDGTKHTMKHKDALYIGKGTKEITFSSEKKNDPAKYYLISYPAHQEYPVQHAKFSDAEKAKLGSQKEANKRTINKYIHQNGIKSCQLVMGLTELEEGSIWNTMPCHTHQRRSEIYLYFGLSDNSVVFHMMGEPNETRHLVIRNQQAVISPSWSIHCGAATHNYTFIWAMGGENQAFDDMDIVGMRDLK